jgi:hypothetical protein
MPTKKPLKFNLFNKNINSDTPLIFLDIDGVFHESFDPENPNYKWIKESVETLNKLIKETGAKIIMSTYRTPYCGFHKVMYDLNTSGLKGEIIDYIQYPMPGDYDNEFINNKNTYIGNYILFNELENFIVTDDYLLFEEGYPTIKPRFIKTNPDKGFSKENYEQAKKLLR